MERGSHPMAPTVVRVYLELQVETETVVLMKTATRTVTPTQAAPMAQFGWLATEPMHSLVMLRNGMIPTAMDTVIIHLLHCSAMIALQSLALLLKTEQVASMEMEMGIRMLIHFGLLIQQELQMHSRATQLSGSILMAMDMAIIKVATILMLV
jgi:hypothetical protein